MAVNAAVNMNIITSTNTSISAIITTIAIVAADTTMTMTTMTAVADMITNTAMTTAVVADAVTITAKK